MIEDFVVSISFGPLQKT